MQTPNSSDEAPSLDIQLCFGLYAASPQSDPVVLSPAG